MIYLTGDTHGHFERIAEFCRKKKTSRADVLVILGDAGINFSGGEIDRQKKVFLSALPVTLFCIHGNHEMRPSRIASYKTRRWHGGLVYAEDEFPDILFAKDGEIYDLNGHQTVVLGGAYSPKAPFCTDGEGWWADEQPSEAIKAEAEARLEQAGWQVDTVLSHTVPRAFEPEEKGCLMVTPDKSTEDWLGTIESRLSYRHWYAGHFHMDRKIGPIQILYERVMEIETTQNDKYS